MGAALAEVERDSFAAADASYGSMVGFLKSGEAKGLTESQLERRVAERIRELARQLIQAHLAERGPGAAAGEVRGADDVMRERARVHERGVETIFGEVRVSRLGYGAEGVESLHPLDADLNLPPELYSLELRRRAAEEAAKQSFEETVASLERQSGTTVGKRQVEQLVQRAAVDFDSFYAGHTPDASVPTGSVLVISADGKGVVMVPRDLREATRKAAAEASPKLEKRLTKGEKRNRKRMATVATVFTVPPYPRTPEQVVRSLAPHRERDPARPRPEHKRVWASLKKDPDQVLEEAFREAKGRDPDRQKSWVALVDGNETQLEILEDLARLYGVELTVVLDIMHVAEYLWDAALGFHPEASKEREEWVSQRLLEVLRGHAVWVAAGIRRSATRRRLRGRQRKPIDTCANYLLKYKAHLRYDEYLAKGFPIATGVIEGACRHLVCDRMDAGARWSLEEAEAVLRLRALRSSGNFDEYWTYHEQREHERNHVARYAGGQVVPVRRGASPLRRIK